MGVTPPPWTGPAVGLMDLDAFFASVEMLDHPNGAVSRSSWAETPIRVASCPRVRMRRVALACTLPWLGRGAALVPASHLDARHFDRYREVSAQVMAILAEETPRVERVSIDEALSISHRVALRPKTRDWLRGV